MTTSPAPQQASAPLSNERAASIGWYFIESYYNFYNSNIESIHKLYHPKASLSHAGFPSTGTSDGDKIHQASGIDAVKARFSNDPQLKKNDSRIVVSNADIQVSLGDKILIVVTGEWSKGGSPYWSFSQTFLLSPGRKENSLDLTNDILRFPGFQDFSRKEGKEEIEEAKEVVAEPKTEAKETKVETKVASEPKAEAVKAAAPKGVAEPKSAEPKNEQEEKSAEPEQKPKKAEATVAATSNKVAAAAAVAATKPEVKDTAKPEEAEDLSSGSAPKLSWAANLAATTVKPTTKTSSKSPVEASATLAEGSSNATSTVASPPSSPLATAVTVASTATKTASVPAATTGANGPKYKKDEWFPIYIRGIRDPISEDSLRKHLSAKFGPIKFLKVNVFIALCDFVDFESQQKALDAKETTISGITIQLEVRESKGGSSNNSSSNNSNGGYTKVGGSKNSSTKENKKPNGDKRIRDKKQGKKVIPAK
ncbi:hypothetical protein CLIB1423_11S01288 [[Candida] railenensis]|uniref:NTF2 domain-containing protein n=1 Tax=[Candida] railenensis TaxID=45579 RepID=A0A9P0QRA2_9ASCO|nr:hypothetical protein CLIB1423_11S01288 [[Candida] railenensis]